MMFFLKKNKEILRAFVNDGLIETFYLKNLPSEKLSAVKIRNHSAVFKLIDSSGLEYEYDFSDSVTDSRYVHFSIRIQDNFAVQADCLISTTSHAGDSAKLYREHKISGIRFQPFFLPEGKVKPEEFIGKGLFERGFHFPGRVTPGNVSCICICDYCRKSFHLQSFHAGFSDVQYFYCSDYPHTLVVSSYIKDVPAQLSETDPDGLNRLESKLPRCSICNGTFHYLNSFLCPLCKKPYIDFRKYPRNRKNEYYGNHIFGEKIQRWDEKPS
ncbi:MAG: hypothetical protein JW774_10365 [Candidatus Aureabacteria bacterium]|nr:hypothetical protein [Candidatus Auribacterota bacterium]